MLSTGVITSEHVLCTTATCKTPSHTQSAVSYCYDKVNRRVDDWVIDWQHKNLATFCNSVSKSWKVMVIHYLSIISATHSAKLNTELKMTHVSERRATHNAGLVQFCCMYFLSCTTRLSSRSCKTWCAHTQFVFFIFAKYLFLWYDFLMKTCRKICCFRFWFHLKWGIWLKSKLQASQCAH